MKTQSQPCVQKLSERLSASDPVKSLMSPIKEHLNDIAANVSRLRTIVELMGRTGDGIDETEVEALSYGGEKIAIETERLIDGAFRLLPDEAPKAKPTAKHSTTKAVRK